MNKVSKALLIAGTILLVPLLTTGCTTAQKSVQIAVERVCDLSFSKRAALRAMIDETTEPHIVRIECN